MPPQPPQESVRQPSEEERVKREFRTFYSAYSTPEERANALEEKLAHWPKELLTEERQSEIRGIGLRATDETSFVEDLYHAIAPLFEYRKTHAEAFERMQRRVILEQNPKWIPLSEALVYHMDPDGFARIHILPMRTAKGLEAYKSMVDGLKKLAGIALEDASICGVVGTSWLVAAGKAMIKRLGFTDEGPIDEEMRNAYFRDEDRPVNTARMSRDVLLDRYGTKQSEKK